MTMLVHITAAKNTRSMRRSGIRAVSGGHEGLSGVYCLPVLPSYQITHQWVRELRRGGQRTLVAVYFRVPDDESVQVGHYSRFPAEMASAKAAALIAAQPDARGYEFFVSRPIRADEMYLPTKPYGTWLKRQAMRPLPQMSGAGPSKRYYETATGHSLGPNNFKTAWLQPEPGQARYQSF